MHQVWSEEHFITFILWYCVINKLCTKDKLALDKNYCKIAEVQERLNRADFGEDYEKPDFSEQFKSEFELLTSLDSTVKVCT